jgi:hypothetical protein
MKYAAALPYGSARTAANLAQIAEQSGWDGIFLGDAIWCEDPMICLAAAAMNTSHIRLGTMVVPMEVGKRIGCLGPPVKRAPNPGSRRRGGMDGVAGFPR